MCKGPEAEKQVRSLIRPQGFRISWALGEGAGRDRCHQAGAEGAQVWGFVPRGGPWTPLKETVPRTWPAAGPALSALCQGQSHLSKPTRVRGRTASEVQAPWQLVCHLPWEVRVTAGEDQGGVGGNWGGKAPPAESTSAELSPGARPGSSSSRVYEPTGHARQPQERSAISRVSLSSSPRAKLSQGRDCVCLVGSVSPELGLQAGRLCSPWRQ